MEKELSGLLRHLFFGHFCGKGIRRGLQRALREPPLALDRSELKAVMASITWKAGEILVSDRVRAIDPPARGHLEWCAWTLAAFGVLRPRFESDQATVDFLGETSVRTFDTRSFRLGIKLLLNRCKGDVELVKTAFGVAMRQYGATFDWHAHESTDGVDLVVTRCFYVEFFRAHGNEALTTALCRLDRLWFDRIEPARHSMSFDHERYETQGYGASTCVFPIVNVTVKGRTQPGAPEPEQAIGT